MIVSQVPPPHRPSSRRRRLSALTVALAVTALVPAVVLGGAAVAAPAEPGQLPTQLAALGSVSPALKGATGTVEVSVMLSQKPVTASVPTYAIRNGTLPAPSVQRSRTAAVESQQTVFRGKAGALGAKVTGSATLSANVVTLTVPAGQITRLAALPGVVSVKPLSRFQTTAGPAPSGSLAQAAQYLGADKVRAKGIDGKGVSVAVLDSGIDFTHANLGGPGTIAAYDACYKGTARDAAPVGACAALFGPSAPKVKGGWDFVGETWDGSTAGGLKPDPNPIDFQGHGTHVADIIGGRSANGTHQGIAPGVDLYAVKVCSALSTACSSVAILQGIDWALDPNRDGDLSDAVEIVNLSLGGAFGLAESDQAAAIDNLVRAGVVAVVAAGNDADRPFIVGSPSTAEGAISVAQTALPDDRLYPIRVDTPTIAGLPGNTVRYAVPVPWAPAPATVVSGTLARPSGPLGCTGADFAGFPSGAIALVARGSCNVAAKARNAQAAGARAVVIHNNVPGNPPTYSFDGGAAITIPTLSISLERGTQLATALAAGTVKVTIDPAKAISLTNTTVASSARGPRSQDSTVKPDIGAPGAWNSAEVGTGNKQTAFSGTSGAAPVVSAVAALVLQAHPKATPFKVKARLLNAADTGNTTLDADAKPYATPVSRIGAGEVRADRAVFNKGLLENLNQSNGNVGLGQLHLTAKHWQKVELTLTNTDSTATEYKLQSVFREKADKDLNAVKIQVPSRVKVPAMSSITLNVEVTIDPSKLPRWPFTRTAGAAGDGSLLNAPEIDGTIVAESSKETLHLGWHVLPHRSADVAFTGAVSTTPGKTTVKLTNTSKVLEATVDAYGLTGTSGELPAPTPGGPGTPGSNAAVVDLAAVGVRDDATTVRFAIADHTRQAVPNHPAEYNVLVDTDRDGTPDYLVFNSELNGRGTTAQSVVAVHDLGTGVITPVSYVVTDFDNAVRVFPVPLAALGLSAGSSFDFQVLAGDAYFTGLVTDEIVGMSWTVGGARFVTSATATVPAGAKGTLTVTTRATAGPSSESGLLLVYGDNASRDFDVVDDL
jgi:subtilisin family serine protease